ncbi:MAG: peptidoglycan editing factor PgeF [Anaerolineae bacterium]|nr:peptidoglycan editing factor PgeF [Anaerolineae bacterium]
MRRVGTSGPVFYQFEQWPGDDGLAHGIFTRLGGVSQAPWQSLNVGSTVGDEPQAVLTNKARQYEALGVDGSRVFTVWQVHGARTRVVNAPLADPDDLDALEQADGLVTDRPGLTLTMRFADCVPVLFYDPTRQVIGMAHAGWRGTVRGAAPSVVRTMVETFGCRPQDIQAGIGPSIGPEHYQVGAEVVAAFREAFADGDRFFHRAAEGTFFLNLWEANRQALAAVGVTQVEIAALCTASHTDEFYSHRAEQGRTGRFGALMTLRA